MMNVFFSYSHKDEDLRNELETHLALLKRQGLISSWHDRRISAGSNFGKDIDSKLESSQIILLLVSAHFLDSDYCYEKEMTRAMQKHQEGSAIIIPVILHPCDWHSAPFGKLRATPTDGKPISMFPNQQEAYAIVARDIREAINLLSAQVVNKDDKGSLAASVEPITHDRSSNLRIKRKFDDHERDEFLESSYEYIANYFEASLQELSARNSNITTKLKRVSGTRFTAFIYDNGRRIAQCSVFYSQHGIGSASIAYSTSIEDSGNSYNESLSVIEDGFTLQLSPIGMAMLGHPVSKTLSQQGAAEYYWSLFIQLLQR
jgi:hypothetical protein